MSIHTPSSVTRVEGICCISGSYSIYKLLCFHFLGNSRIHCICTILFAKSLLFCVYLGAPASLAIGNFPYLISRSGIPAGCVPYCTGSQTERLPHPKTCEESHLQPGCMYVCTDSSSQKVAQWKLRGIDVHAEEPLQCQEGLGLDITPRGKRRKCSSFIQQSDGFKRRRLSFIFV